MDLGREGPCQLSRLGSDCLENSSAEETLGVLVCSKLSLSQQWALAAGMANSILGCANRSTTSRVREEIILLYSALTRLHLE